MMEHDKSANHNVVDTTPPHDLSLSYPTLPIDASIAARFVLVPEDNDMRPALPSRTPSEAASTLEDSTYDLVSNRDLSESGIFSDDEDARTESLASYDDNTPDDISLVNSGDESDEEDVLNTPLDSVMVNDTYPLQQSIMAEDPVVNVTPTIGDSGYTSRTVRPEQSLAFLDFHIDDAESTVSSNVHLVHTVQTIDEINCNRELGGYDTPYVGVEMHMAASKALLPQPDDFRVLLVGQDSFSTTEVAEHIKSALTVASIGQGRALSLVVQHCVDADFGVNKREVMLELDNPSTAVTLRGGQVYHGKASYPLWDVAIFLHSSLATIYPSDASRLENMFEKARLGLRAAWVPIIDLSTRHPLYQAVPHVYTCDRKSLHLRVTTKENRESEEVVREMLPVDLDHFLAIDPRTLNRHLACITESHASVMSSGSIQKKSTVVNFRETTKNAMYGVRRTVTDSVPPNLKVIGQRLTVLHVLTAASLALFALLFCTQNLGPSFVSKIPAEHPFVQPVAQVASAPHDGWIGFMSKVSDSSVAIVSSTPTIVSSRSAQPKAVCKKPEKESTRELHQQKERDMVAEAWKDYSLEVVDERALVLKAPSNLARLIRPNPKLVVTVNDKPISIKVKPLSTGSWAIQTSHDIGPGTSILTLRAEYQLQHLGKFPFEYQIAIYEDKSSFEKVKDLVAQEFVLVQDNMAELSTRMTTGLQQYIGSIQQQTLAVRKQAIKRVNETKNALIDLPREVAQSRLEAKKRRIRHLKQAQQAIRKQGKELVVQVQAAVRDIQEVALQQYDGVVNAIRAMPQWRRDTAWPVRAADWNPHVAARRSLGNAQGLLRKIRGAPKSIEGCMKGQVVCHGQRGKCTKCKKVR
jgi:hypothetical protein